MSLASIRRQKREDEYFTFAGRTDFPDSAVSPKGPDCDIALYGVLWTGRNGRRTGNSWTSRRHAERVRDEKIANGTFLGTLTTYCGGFAF